MSCYLALDAGTGSLRAALYPVDDGRSVGAVDIPFALDIRGRREVSFLAVWEAVE